MLSDTQIIVEFFKILKDKTRFDKAIKLIERIEQEEQRHVFQSIKNSLAKSYTHNTFK